VEQIKYIDTGDILAWISFLKTQNPQGEGLSEKTVSRKLTALSNYFQWLISEGVIEVKTNPMLNIANSRISSPLPEILFEEECKRLLSTASADPRIYLLFLLFLQYFGHFFERKGLTNEATNWLNVVIEFHFPFNRCMAYDNCQRHPETDARARSTAAEVPGHVVRHDPCAARSRQLPQSEPLLRLL
jgi:hypothetical protein